MVMKCERCQMDFKYESLLTRHLTRKKKCEKVEVKCETNENKCKYCKKTMATIYTKHRHENTCKYKDDYVRNLELQLDVEVEYEYSNDTCRFCGKTMHTNNLYRHENSCKEKEVYKTKLQNMLKAHNARQGNVTINNNTINNTYNHNGDNNNTINITLRPFGNENLDYITPKYIMRLMDKAKCQFTGEAEKLRFATLMYKAIHGNPEHPENHNMLIPSLKGSNALVYTDEGFEHIHRRVAEDQVCTTIADTTYGKIALEQEDEEDEKSREKCRRKYPQFVKRYVEGEETYDNDNDETKYARVRGTIAQASYNCKEVVKDTQKIPGNCITAA